MTEAMVVARPVLEGATERASGFEGYVRQGTTLELKAFTGVAGDSGGFAVPREIDAEIDGLLKAASPIRQVANVVKVGTAGYRKLVTAGGTPSGWAAETAGRPETGTPAFHEIAPPMGELYANPSASQAMLDDAAFDVEQWLAAEIAAEFAKAEGAAFVTGNGVARPKGFLTYPTVATADGARVRDDPAHRQRRGGRFRRQSAGAADRPRPVAAFALSAGRELRDERRHGGAHPQVQDERRRLRVAAGAGGGPAGDAAGLSGAGGRGHARHRGGRGGDRVRQFPAGLCGRRTQ